MIITFMVKQNIKYIANRNLGFVLVTVLLFLSIISLLFVTLNENVWLTSNMNNYLKDKTDLFYQAEYQLMQIEKQLLQQKSCDNYQILYSSCGIQICQASIKLQRNNTFVKLNSSVAIIDKKESCPIMPNEHEGRLSWWAESY